MDFLPCLGSKYLTPKICAVIRLLPYVYFCFYVKECSVIRYNDRQSLYSSSSVPKAWEFALRTHPQRFVPLVIPTGLCFSSGTQIFPKHGSLQCYTRHKAVSRQQEGSCRMFTLPGLTVGLLAEAPLVPPLCHHLV